MHSVFISHSWHDKALARKLAKALESLGGRVWLDEAEIKVGDSLVQKIRAGIDSVDYVVALLSHKSVRSEWVTKELDIAMNQEIEGRRVKVLPVLASECELPGFLKGKLYADMSNPRAYRQSLPMLFDRLGVTRETIAKARRGKAVRDEDTFRLARQLARDLKSSDDSVRYLALKAVETWRVGDILHDSQVRDLLFQMTSSDQPPHIRLRSLELLGQLADSAFAYRVEPCLNEELPQIVAAAVNCLRRFEAESSGVHVLDVLAGTQNSQVRLACLKFFAQIELDPSLALALVSLCADLGKAPHHSGMARAIAEAMVKQIGSFGAAEAVLPYVVSALDSGDDLVRTAVLDGLTGAEFFFSETHLTSQLVQAILRCSDAKTPGVVARAWLAMVVLTEQLTDFEDRNVLWARVSVGDGAAIETWLGLLDNYVIHRVFDDPQDVGKLQMLFGRFGDSVDRKIAHVMCEIGNVEALDFLSEIHYAPQGWEKISVLRPIAMGSWKASYEALLTTACSDLGAYTGSEGTAVALLAQFTGGRLGITKLVADLPRTFAGVYSGAAEDRKKLAERLRSIASSVPPRVRPQLSRVIRALSRRTDNA